MTAKRNVQKALRNLLNSRRGTAEIVGSIMFLLIMMFFFTNVFLWHDRATREMDNVISDKMNSPVSIQVVNRNMTDAGGQERPRLPLKVTNNGGVGVELSRLWIIRPDGNGGEIHEFRDMDDWIDAGKSIPIWLDEGNVTIGSENFFRIVTTRGNMAVCSCVPVEISP